VSLVDPDRQDAEPLEELSPLYGDTPAWLVSLLVHMVLLIVLALIGLYLPTAREAITLTVYEAEEPLPREFYFSEEVTPEVGAESLNGIDAALAAAPVPAELDQVEPEAAEFDMADIQVEDTLDVTVGAQLLKHMAVKGEVGVGVTGAMGAIDRITHEILLSLEERRTLVVWLFDQSGSLESQRKAIYERFDRIYEELGIIKSSGHPVFENQGEQPLLTSVMAFGKEVTFRTVKPTADMAEIKQAVATIENDPSGQESVFSAVSLAAERMGRYRSQGGKRNVMVVVFTDEAGDDEARMEHALGSCLRYQVPVYVIGSPAPFGRREAMVKYVDPDPQFDQSVQWIPVRMGPESMAPERLRLSFSATDARDLDQLDSGFGPYFLTRLCYETGGIYFSVHPNKQPDGGRAAPRNTPVMSAQLSYFFDEDAMRRYRPDYVSIREYEQFVSENKARGALVEAARRSWLKPMEGPRLQFPKRNDGALKQDLTEAQKKAAKLEPRINDLYQVLKLGSQDRGKLKEPRWQAGYDLAMGRVLAVKARTEGYNAMLAALKRGKVFENENNDTWILRPANEISTGSQLEKNAKQAHEYLRRVVEEHPDTPWALLAQRELNEPLGWMWTEIRTGVNDPPPPQGNNNNPLPRDDQLRKLDKPKPKRSNIKL
jgi:hypothetical protein